ncbi:MAG: hybrid sensor histidine kinase/response regulator [Leptospiraceae bacterium]|nr:hybrid sensor histidine kinase/response regulator [Leptospiraceae bacterium]
MTRPLIHKPAFPLLIVEDQIENQVLLRELCAELELPCEIASNGKEALEKVQNQSYSVYVVDLLMPVMGGREFIAELKKIHPQSVVLVQTALDQPETIIEVMKLGVFDYLIKPIDHDVFYALLQKTLEYYYLRESERMLSESAGLKLRSQLEWLNYKEARRKSADDSMEVQSIQNLRTSLSQGAGIGTMVTLISMIADSSSRQNGSYSVPAELFETLCENNDYIRTMLDGLHRVSEIMQGKTHQERMDVAALMQIVTEVIQLVQPYYNRKEIAVHFTPYDRTCELNVDRDALRECLIELAVNAYKYTIQGGRVDIFCYRREGYFCLSIKNDVGAPEKGVPAEYEKLVLEPFFRLHPPDESIAGLEQFGLGLGLTVVEHTARKHGGLFFIHNMEDYTLASARSVVVSEILLPLVV